MGTQICSERSDKALRKGKGAGSSELVIRALDLRKALDRFRIELLARLALDALDRSVADEDKVNLILVGVAIIEHILRLLAAIEEALPNLVVDIGFDEPAAERGESQRPCRVDSEQIAGQPTNTKHGS